MDQRTTMTAERRGTPLLRRLAPRTPETRDRFYRALELVAVLALLGTLAASYVAITRGGAPQNLLPPSTVTLLLVANLVPALAFMMLVARRIAQRRAARSALGGSGRLHVRLVALFSVLASVPTLILVIFASLLFQTGVEYWFSDRVRTVIGNADRVASVYAEEHRARITREMTVMSGDVVATINSYGLDSERFAEDLFFQTVYRDLSELALVSLDDGGRVQLIAQVNLDQRPLEARFSAAELRRLRPGTVAAAEASDRMEAIARLDPTEPIFLYASRRINPTAIAQIAEAKSASGDYQRTLRRSRTLQFRFNALLILFSLLLVGLAIWIALKLADRLVRPLGELVDAAGQVSAGDLSARVPPGDPEDEVGALGNAFNAMTTRLEAQTGALRNANAQLDSRRAFTEAVLSGVSAGVVSVDRERRILLANPSATEFLGGEGELAGVPLRDLAPDLDRWLDGEERDGIVQAVLGGEALTLAVRRVRVDGGEVITFDDITQAQNDQRRAAWSDVARRIAHEIKNPLTPIQLAAERLQRRYGREVQNDPGTFERLTGTIVRQVGDLRRMVDEFSSFARMPKPVFRPEPVNEIARQALFLHEIAHPDIGFRFDAPEPSPVLVCDRRQLGQALTNVVKNAVEAIEAKGEADGEREVAMRVAQEDGMLVLEVADSGVGLPPERERITEPYMTTRARGTGLGLAIVQKIIDEHLGQIRFADRPGGGALVRISLDPRSLAPLGTLNNENEPATTAAEG